MRYGKWLILDESRSRKLWSKQVSVGLLAVLRGLGSGTRSLRRNSFFFTDDCLRNDVTDHVCPLLNDPVQPVVEFFFKESLAFG